ncbi:2-dehydropantoate 2-reductase [Paraburkholderia caribensis]|uniref:2-dehydropantoate 2-reductase n=1 Tax=Paraburkholderia caribensis TaxID=75105 RepID=UPI00078E4C84|nr:2-dehydropantoate 2-reductase [Paraburkholderia caribensis]AMV48310.1 2-dehydropantoate 2-reductase [Paraburkholderia caribensis]
MHILIVGAGGTGGYFGGRLAASGRDVTFLVRPKRADVLRSNGLSIRSSLGDMHVARPQLVTADQMDAQFNLIVLSCKAYDLGNAIESFAPAVGPTTAVLPLLNGMAHLAALRNRFGAAAVLGGTCFVSSTLASDGTIIHMNDTHSLTFGELGGGLTSRVEAIAEQLSDAGFEAVLSENIIQQMWNKWVFIAASAGMTCLMRSSIGNYVASGAGPMASQLVDECAAVAAAAGYALSTAAVESVRSYVTQATSAISTSMLRDIESNSAIEADQIIGDMLERACKLGPSPILATVYAHLKSYETRRDPGEI